MPLLVATGLAEGAGLFLFSSLLHGTRGVPIAARRSRLIATRWLLWRRYRRHLVAAPQALAALDAAARPLLWFGTSAPLALVALRWRWPALAGGAIDVGTPALAAGLAGSTPCSPAPGSSTR